MGSTALGYSASSIKGEAKHGSLKLRLQSRFSLPILLFVQMCIYFMSSIITWTGLAIISVVTGTLEFSDYIYIIISFLICIPSIVGMYGMGLILGSLTLIEKNIGQFVYLLQMALLFISNSLSPTRTKLVNIIPFNSGIQITRDLYLNKSVNVIDIGIYFLVNVVWLVIGVTIFKKVLNKVKKNGSFYNY